MMSWRELGNDWATSMLNSGVLSTGRRVHPAQAARAEADADFDEMMLARRRRMMPIDDAARRRESSEHEAAHFVVAQALGIEVNAAAVAHNGDGGGCFHERAPRFETATIALAGELWIGMYRSLEYPRGPMGCEADRRAAIDAVGSDMNWELGRAHRRCFEILKENRAIVLSLGDRIDRDGNYIPTSVRNAVRAASTSRADRLRIVGRP